MDYSKITTLNYSKITTPSKITTHSKITTQTKVTPHSKITTQKWMSERPGEPFWPEFIDSYDIIHGRYSKIKAPTVIQTFTVSDFSHLADFGSKIAESVAKRWSKSLKNNSFLNILGGAV